MRIDSHNLKEKVIKMLTTERITELRDSFNTSLKKSKKSTEDIQITLVCTSHNKDAIEFASDMGVTLPNNMVVKSTKVAAFGLFADQDGHDGIAVNGEFIECLVTDQGTQSVTTEKKFRNSKFSMKATKNLHCYEIQLSSAWFILLSPLCKFESTDSKVRTVMNNLPFVEQIEFQYATGATAKSEVLTAS